MFLSQSIRLAVKIFLGASPPDRHPTAHIDSPLPRHWLRQPTRLRIFSLKFLTRHSFDVGHIILHMFIAGGPRDEKSLRAPTASVTPLATRCLFLIKIWYRVLQRMIDYGTAYHTEKKILRDC